MTLVEMGARRAILVQILAYVVFGVYLSSFLVNFYVYERNQEQRPRIADRSENFTVPVSVKGGTAFVTPAEAEETELLPICMSGTMAVAAALTLFAGGVRKPPFHPIPEVRANLLYADQPNRSSYAKFFALGFAGGLATLVFAGPSIAQSLAQQHGRIL